MPHLSLLLRKVGFHGRIYLDRPQSRPTQYLDTAIQVDVSDYFSINYFSIAIFMLRKYTSDPSH